MVAAGRMAPNSSPWTASTSAERDMSVTYIRVRTTSPSVKPASERAFSTMANAARAWPPGSAAWSERPSGPASVVPETQQLSPTTTARL
jgi:hypothetical protein